MSNLLGVAGSERLRLIAVDLSGGHDRLGARLVKRATRLTHQMSQANHRPVNLGVLEARHPESQSKFGNDDRVVRRNVSRRDAPAAARSRVFHRQLNEPRVHALAPLCASDAGVHHAQIVSRVGPGERPADELLAAERANSQTRRIGEFQRTVSKRRFGGKDIGKLLRLLTEITERLTREPREVGLGESFEDAEVDVVHVRPNEMSRGKRAQPV